MLPLLSGLYAPAPKPVSAKPLQLTIGNFFPQGRTGSPDSSLGVSYQTQLRLGALPPARVYLDSNRKKNLFKPTATTTSTTVRELQGLGLSWNARVIGLGGSQAYQLAGLGLYRQRSSVDATNRTGYSLGGKIGFGYRKDDVFAELDYTLVGRINGSDPSGATFRIGFRL